MGERAYTVAEIDRMRAAVEYTWLYGGRIRDQVGDVVRCYKAEEKAVCVEEMLRTYMMAGVEPEELE